MNSLTKAAVVMGVAMATLNPVFGGTVAAKKPSAILTASTDAVTECLATPGTYAVTRLMKPDGTVGAFNIPAGQVFVITAVELRGNGGLARANRDAQLSLFRESASGASVSEGLVEYGTLDAQGLLSTWRTGTNMVVKSGARLCARADDLTNGQTFLALTVVHGFLTADR